MDPAVGVLDPDPVSVELEQVAAGERYGAKRMWITAVALFTVGSALCGLAWCCPRSSASGCSRRWAAV
ncbi:hypothetical protein AB0L65_06870 [Nonomuraea sp. NPDC052116]|uniref:hypothetical protein n=1 Tax=Nonomuraea sp. NPDC052116 TaxID=3155665 RepID=UPI0034488AC8